MWMNEDERERIKEKGKYSRKMGTNEDGHEGDWRFVETQWRKKNVKRKEKEEELISSQFDK